MNEKLTLQDLVDLLALKKGITKKDAELFLKEFFSVLTDTLCNNETVKIKDLGTFKLTTVSRRESVDVNTGDKIEIPAHYRLSFQPDKELRELVNKPFASFESILLEEGEEKGDITFDIANDVEEVLIETDFENDEDEEDSELDVLTHSVIGVAVEEDIVAENKIESAKVETELDKPDEKIDEPEYVKPEPEEEKAVRGLEPQVSSKIHVSVPVIPPVEYSYSTTVEASGEMASALSTINKQAKVSASIIANASVPTFRESSSNEIPPKEVLLPVIEALNESDDLSRNLLSDNDNEDMIVPPLPVADSAEQEDENDDQTLYEDIPEFYSYQPSFWTKLWRKLPLILFILIVIGGLTYAFLKLFDVQYDYERFFGKKATATTISADSLQNEIQQDEPVLELDSLAGETSKKLDSLKQQYKENRVVLIEPKENIPNVNKAEEKLMGPQAESRSGNSSVLAKETMKSGATLRTMATRYYGQGAFWVYIYEENKNNIEDPDNVPLGLSINIPKAEKYGINAKDIASVSLAKEKEFEIVRKARQKRFQQALSD